MTDFFFQMGLSNACFSLALAIVAMVVGAKAKRPHLAHMLWLLVFIKLVTPPIVKIPIVTIPQQSETAVAINEHSRPGPPLANSREFDVDAQPDASLSSRLVSAAWNHARVWLPPIWLLGSVVVFAWSMVRVCRFSRLLAAKSEVAPQELQTAAVKIARRLELNTIPTIYTTSARLSPMVWWTGGKVRIVIPTTLLDQMDAHEWQWVLAHELAHIRRRDYMVRWLEWLACVCFWWNPVVWWAQRNLRANEELCCDALVISSLKPRPLTYANSLLTAVEYLACPALRPPAMASEINSGGFFERRFKMIVSETPNRVNSRWLRACVLLCAMVVLPLGIASAQDYEAVEKRLGEAVSKGELTLEHAGLMMDVLRKAGGAKDKKEVDYGAIGKKIRAAVAAGKITKEEGRAKMAAIKKEAGGAKKDQSSDRAKAYLMKVRKDLGALVKAGKISREDAAKRYQGAEKAIKERMAVGRSQRGSKRITREDLARAGIEIRKVVAEGKISAEEGRAKMAAMRKMMAGQGGRGERRISREDVARKGIDWEGIKKRIEGAVKSGKMTREEADAKYKEIKKRMAGQGERDSKRISREDAGKRGVDWEGIKKRIEGAVKSGKMTRKEADAKYKEIRERMAERRER